MPLSSNAQLVTHIFDEVTRGNGAPFWDACADTLVWRTIGHNSWSGEFRGKATVIDEIFRPLRRRLATQATIPTRIIDGGDIIVVQARGRNVTHTGLPYENDYCFVIHFEDGRIAHYEEYCDTELVTSILGERA